jgi:hypothetical protein
VTPAVPPLQVIALQSTPALATSLALVIPLTLTTMTARLS